MREADWDIGVIRQAGRDVSDLFRGFAVGVIGIAIAAVIAAAVFAPDPNASLGTRVAAGLAAPVALTILVFLVVVFVAPYRQRNAARQRVTELEEQIAEAEDRDRIIRSLEALRRDFLKNENWLNNPGGGPNVAQPLLIALVSRLKDAQRQLRPVSPEAAGEFDDLAKILEEQTDLRRSTIAQLQAEGKRLFDRAIDRLATPH